MDNHYTVLNVAMYAPDVVIRAAYRVLAAQFHPDRHVSDPTMLQRMQQVTAAYRVLSDPQRRAEHDRQLRRLRRRRASDVATSHRAVGDTPSRDAVAAITERAPLAALARRRAFAAAEYARHAAL